MNYSYLDGRTLFFHGVANIHQDTRPPRGPTIGLTEKFGTLKVDQSGKAVRLGTYRHGFRLVDRIQIRRAGEV
jgi:hypothetical protein